MNKAKKTGISSIAILLVIFMCSSILAFGVAIPYWDSPEWYPLKLAPGESKIVQLTLQNTGEENMNVRATITGNIATLNDKSDEYSVPSGEINQLVNIKVEIPKDAKIGETYKVYSSFQEISSGEGGMIKMAGAVTINFPVEVVGEEESELYTAPEKNQYFLWIIFVALLIGIIVIAIVKNKKKIKRK